MRLLPVLPLLFLTATLRAEPAQDRIVVLISVDGLSHYYFDDPKAEMPTIRRLAREGARAKMMKASMPTVTWPNHTTLVTGVEPAKHGVIGNTYWDRAQKKVIPLLPDPLFNKEEIVKSPTIYDAAKRAGLRTAAIIWPASRGAATLDWTMPDVFANALFQQYGTASLQEEFKAAGIPFEKQEEYCKTGKGRERDIMYVQMLNHIIRAHRPNLALLHLIELDHVEHAKGPQSAEAYEICKFEDDRVREVWEELQRDCPGKATLIVASDHGFFPYQQQIQPNVLLRKAGLLEADGTKITGGQARAVGQGGAAYIYVLDQANRATLIEKIVLLCKEVEGVGLVLSTPQEYQTYGLADPAKDDRMADVVISAKSGYTFTDSLAGDLVVTPKTEEIKGTHGYDPKEPGMHASFVAWGVGIKPGAELGLIENTSVAPTMAALLGIPMPSADGRVLEEFLVK
jgi:predicted AlkP superfamily pyrophosphatase or phosphodiesterase